MQNTHNRPYRSANPWVVTGVLLISLLLRWVLILRGGQYFNSDETRYEVSLAAARLFWQGQFAEALRQFTISPEHLGFKVIGLIPALTEHLVGPSLVLPAMFFSLFSVLNLFLIFLLSQRTSDASNQPVYALFFASSSMSLLYYSRHLFPYDAAMSFGLMALYSAVVRRHGVGVSLACGGLSFLCFITYNGYWPLAAFAMLAHVLVHDNGILSRLRRSLVTAAAFLVPLTLVIVAMLGSGTNLISAYRLFATSITQGLFQEGWSLPFEYFWYAEQTIFVITGTLAVLAVWSRSRNPRRYTWLWLGGFVFIYLCLVIPSVVLQYFVVYARLARQLLPFLILLAAVGLVQLQTLTLHHRRITQLVFAVVFFQAAWNYAAAFRIGFPRDFSTEAQVKFPGFEFSSKRLAYGAPVVCRYNEYVIENAKFYVMPPEKLPAVQGQLLLSEPHPTNYEPYLYEGDPPEYRQAYRALRLQMRFYEADPAFVSERNPAWTSMESCVIRGN